MNVPAHANSALPLVETAQAWYRADLAKRSEWIHTLEPVEVEEIECAIAHAEAIGKDLPDLQREDFPLNALMIPA